MALINTLREKSGKVLVIAIGLAMFSFILADLLGLILLYLVEIPMK